MEAKEMKFLPLAGRTIVCHTITYMFMGALAAYFFHYAEMMRNPASGMRPMSSPLVMAGPLWQPIRGIVFASVIFPLRAAFFGKKNGWLLLSWMLVALGILCTFAPAAGSFEGFVFTTVPILMQLRGWCEVVPQAILLSALLCYWVNHPQKKWFGCLLSILFVLTLALVTLGLCLPAAK
jgi:hypothetical protein